MKHVLPLLALIALLPASAAAQSLYGPGGLFLHPTATITAQGKLTPAILVLPQHDPQDDVTRTWISGSVDYGLCRDLEIGGTFVKVAGWDRDPSFGGFVKYRFLRENSRLPAAAIGFTGLGFGDVDTRTAFLALRKEFKVGRWKVAGNVGVQYADVVDGGDRDEFQPYGGLELGLTSRLTFIVEGRPRGNSEFGTPLALTLSYRAAENWHLALTWANNGLSDEPKFGFGAGLSLGAR